MTNINQKVHRDKPRTASAVAGPDIIINQSQILDTLQS